MYPFHSKDTFFFGEELLAPRSTLKLEDHPLLAVLHIGRPVHPQPEDAPYCADRDRLIVALNVFPYIT